jgi:RNA polymerase primary sigma factor
MHASAAVRRTSEVSGVESLTTYLREITSYRLLAREEESALGKRIREGDHDAVDQLVCANLRFVVSVAKKFHNRGVALADLINEGNLGLVRAAAKFDESKGVKFISYAVWWIRQAMIQALAEYSHAVRVPVARASALRRIGRQASALRQELVREPTQREIAAELDVSEAEIASTMAIARTCLSLDAPMSENEDGKLFDVLPDDVSPAPDERLADHGLATSVEAALGRLRGREAKVLRQYFGLDGDEPMTLEEIARSLGITRERVRQIKEKALARMRKAERTTALASFYAG